MSEQHIVNDFSSLTLAPSVNLSARSTIPAQKKERIKRSQLFSRSLAGRAGLLREIGASYDHGAVTSAWAENLGHEYSLTSPFKSYLYYPYVNGFGSVVYDEDTRSIIAAAEHCVIDRVHSSMSYPPLSPLL